MNASQPEYRSTWLWKQAFAVQRDDSSEDEQQFFMSNYEAMRERVKPLVSQIEADIPGLTIHDITHLDALWDMASLVTENAISINPVEAFVFGASILLHDAGLTLAAYPGGLEELKSTLAWRDMVAKAALTAEEQGSKQFDVEDPPQEIVEQVLPKVLRRLHAERAEVLAEQSWQGKDGSKHYLIQDDELRQFYGPTIGQIAHSHWWPARDLAREFSENLGALAIHTHNTVDRLKLACLLRVADVLHIDSRRAPRFKRALLKPAGLSSLHWSFQERFARPYIERDAVVFTVGQPFGREDADAWWLAHDSLLTVDRELRDVDMLLQDTGRNQFNVRRVEGVSSANRLALTVRTKDWQPVDARVRISDVPRIVEQLGGSKLYGDDPTVALRELIQNAADAVQARRRIQNRSEDWGTITVGLYSENNQTCLFVEDNGIGMSERVLTSSLLDYGESFWRSDIAVEEFPGLMKAGMRPIGRFGIGFFSVFMLGSNVRVYSRRYDSAKETGRMLEFRVGLGRRPILSSALGETAPIDGGTRVEVILDKNPLARGGLLRHTDAFSNQNMRLESLVGWIAPNLNVQVVTQMNRRTSLVSRPGDWLRITDNQLECRLDPDSSPEQFKPPNGTSGLMCKITDSHGQVYGRACIWTGYSAYSYANGCVTISGLRATRAYNVRGILLGEAATVARNVSRPIAPPEALAVWATSQAEKIASLELIGEIQARVAEVVLECEGEVGELKLVRWGSKWLSRSEFEERIASHSEIAISFDGEFEYDEAEDDVLPRDFDYGFSVSDEVAITLKHDGSIVHIGPRKWPRCATGKPKPAFSNVALLVENLILQVWNNGVEEKAEAHVVGTVDDVDIVREVTVFRRTDIVAKSVTGY